MTRKYDALGDFLAGRHEAEIVLSLAEIEGIIGDALPASARTYKPWWANTPIPSRHSEAWLGRGWLASENLASGFVTFSRAPDGGVPQRFGPSTPKLITPGPVLDHVMNDVAISYRWSGLGGIVVVAGRISFPVAPVSPAVYRMRIEEGGIGHHYIGETSNLRRRLGHYVRPGHNQETNIRINALIAAAATAGARMSLDAVMDGVVISVGGAAIDSDLRSKQVRKLVEQAAIVASHGIELANR